MRSIFSTISMRLLWTLLTLISCAGISYSAPLVSPVAAAEPPKPILEQAYGAARDHDWKKAAQKFESARAEKPLDYRGLLALSFAYRQLEECPKAIGPLTEMQQRANRKKLTSKEKKLVRHGLFLLARCYAKNRDAGRTLFILNGYLLDPKKFKNELRQSLQRIEFGGIRTQSDFQDYEKAARKALSRIGVSTDTSSYPSNESDVGGGASMWNETTDPSGSGGGSGF